MSSFEGLGPLPPLVDCDSDSDSDDEGEFLQERRARLRRALFDLAEEAEQMLLGRGGLREPSGLAGPTTRTPTLMTRVSPCRSAVPGGVAHWMTWQRRRNRCCWAVVACGSQVAWQGLRLGLRL